MAKQSSKFNDHRQVELGEEDALRPPTNSNDTAEFKKDKNKKKSKKKKKARIRMKRMPQGQCQRTKTIRLNVKKTRRIRKSPGRRRNIDNI